MDDTPDAIFISGPSHHDDWAGLHARDSRALHLIRPLCAHAGRVDLLSSILASFDLEQWPTGCVEQLDEAIYGTP